MLKLSNEVSGTQILFHLIGLKNVKHNLVCALSTDIPNGIGLRQSLKRLGGVCLELQMYVFVLDST